MNLQELKTLAVLVKDYENVHNCSLDIEVILKSMEPVKIFKNNNYFRRFQGFRNLTAFLRDSLCESTESNSKNPPEVVRIVVGNSTSLNHILEVNYRNGWELSSTCATSDSTILIMTKNN